MPTYPFVDYPSLEALKQPDRTIYVTKDGSDLTGTGAVLAPFGSIQAALTFIAGSPTPPTATDPYAVKIGPGEFGDNATPITVPDNIKVEGSTGTTITTNNLTLGDNVTVLATNIDASTITVEPDAITNIQNVYFIAPSTTVNNSNSNSTVYTTNVTAEGSVTYNAGNVIQRSDTYNSALIVNNATSYSAISNTSLSVSVNNSTASITSSKSDSLSTTNSTTTVSNSNIPGNITASGGSTEVKSSSVGGTATGLSGAGISFSLDSYPQGGTSLSGGATTSSLTVVPQSIVVVATATDSTATVVGTIYFAQPRTLTTGSLAYFGGSAALDVTTLEIKPAGGGSAVATWTRTGLLGNQALGSAATIPTAGWYDLVLTPGVSGTAFSQGIYLV
jgi:hypothetical protein